MSKPCVCGADDAVRCNMPLVEDHAPIHFDRDDICVHE